MTICTTDYEVVNATYEGGRDTVRGAADYVETEGVLPWVVIGSFSNTSYGISGSFEWK